MRKQEKKKIEEEKGIEEAKSAQAAHIVTLGSEEDSPRKAPLASRTYRVLGAVAKKSLFQDLKEMTAEEEEELGQKIDKCYRVKVTQTEDSGRTRDIVSESIVRDLGLKPLVINGADGNTLNVFSGDWGEKENDRSRGSVWWEG